MPIIHSIRRRWMLLRTAVPDYHFNFLEELNLPRIVLASAFKVRNIPYHWEKGVVERWR